MTNPIILPRVTAMGRQLDATEPDYLACYTSYSAARDALASKDREIERLQPFEEQTRHLERRIRELTEQLNCLKLDRFSVEPSENHGG